MVGVDAATVVTVVMSILAIAGTLSGIVIGWKGNARTNRNETITDTSRDVKLQVDVEYIKRGIDDLKVEQRLQGQQYDELSKQVIKVDESTRSAHKRIDRLEGVRE